MNHFVVTDSTMILCIGYDKAQSILEVVFSTSLDYVYEYKNVSLQTVNGLMFGESIGSYFAANIKSHYPFIKKPISATLKRKLHIKDK